MFIFLTKVYRMLTFVFDDDKNNAMANINTDDNDMFIAITLAQLFWKK